MWVCLQHCSWVAYVLQTPFARSAGSLSEQNLTEPTGRTLYAYIGVFAPMNYSPIEWHTDIELETKPDGTLDNRPIG